MADAKSKSGGKGKEAPKPVAPNPVGIIVKVLLFIIVIGQVFSFLSNFLGFTDSQTGLLNERLVENVKRSAVNVLLNFQFISLSITFIFIIALLYVKFKMYELERLDLAKKKAEDIALQKIKDKPEPNKKWLKVKEHVSSQNPSDWRLAILEADIILAEVLRRSGYAGDTIGEMLKQIERSDLKSLNEAWEAHKIRNMIAHEGSDYKLNQGEAKRVIGLYESVFREFSIL